MSLLVEEPPQVLAVSHGTLHIFSNHGLVLLFVAAHPEARERDIAGAIGITERSTTRIVSDLAAAGYIDRQRTGRRNLYRVNLEVPLLHPLWKGRTVRDFLAFLGSPPESAADPF